MQRNELLAALKLNNVNLEALARSCGVRGPVIHRAISGNGRSRRAEEAVAAAIGRTRIEVFGPNKREKGDDS